jgi:hypothetical protein
MSPDEQQAEPEHRSFMLNAERALSRRHRIARAAIIIYFVTFLAAGLVMCSCPGFSHGRGPALSQKQKLNTCPNEIRRRTSSRDIITALSEEVSRDHQPARKSAPNPVATSKLRS